MNYKPILFSTEMVRAILEGRKTMTRRIVRPQPDDSGLHDHTRFPMSPQSDLEGWWGTTADTGEMKQFKCRYGSPGILRVRETWAKVTSFPEPDCFGAFLFKSMGDTPDKWKPSIFMPKAACRLFLEIVDIRVERLQSISEADATSEGITLGNFPDDLPGSAFCSLWTKINGADSWNANPWVWVISFKRIDKPEGFV